jgi:hypothetical protein
MLDAVTDALIGALNAAGINAATGYPDERADRSAAAVYVSPGDGELSSSGCGEYLGTGMVDGAETELYGCRAEMEIRLDVYAETAARCAELCTQLCGALDKLPAGLKMRGFSCGGPESCRITGGYTRRCVLKCFAFLTRTADQETGEFTDFVLRGAMKT